jgi:hypothetical protein
MRGGSGMDAALRIDERRIVLLNSRIVITVGARGGVWALALGVGLGWVGVTPFDALVLLWNLYCFWFICSAPVRGGTHFLCCCKAKKAAFHRECLPVAARLFLRSGPTGGVSLAGFHRCWHLDKVRASHRDTKWISSHSSVLALRARRQSH